MSSRLAQVPVWAAHRLVGLEQRRAGERLLIEWPEGADGPTDYWLCQLAGASVGLRRLIRVARARWRVELDYRELKEELGLDHCEGRHWLGWHRAGWVSSGKGWLGCCYQILPDGAFENQPWAGGGGWGFRWRWFRFFVAERLRDVGFGGGDRRGCSFGPRACEREGLGDV